MIISPAHLWYVTHTHRLLPGSVCVCMYVYMDIHTLADNVMMTQNVFVCSCVVVCVFRCGRVLWVIRRRLCCCTAGAARLWESQTLWVVCLWPWLIHVDTHGWHAVWRSYTHTLRHKNTHLTQPRLRTGPCLHCPAAPTQVTHTHTLHSRCALHGLGLSCDEACSKFRKCVQFNI